MRRGDDGIRDLRRDKKGKREWKTSSRENTLKGVFMGQHGGRKACNLHSGTRKRETEYRRRAR